MKNLLLLLAAVASLASCISQPTSMQSELFARIDTERPGGIGREEFINWNISRLFAVYDTEDRGYLTLQDWRARRGPRLDFEFRRLDRNGDGRVTLAEIKSNPLVRSHMQELFDEIDYRHKGVITRREIESSQVNGENFL
jgi:EF hand